jgi:hypothetical protein
MWTFTTYSLHHRPTSLTHSNLIQSRAPRRDLKILPSTPPTSPTLTLSHLLTTLAQLVRQATNLRELTDLARTWIQCRPLALVVVPLTGPEEPALSVDDGQWIGDGGVFFELYLLGRLLRWFGQLGDVHAWRCEEGLRVRRALRR